MDKTKVTLQTMVIHRDIDGLGIYEALRKVKAIGYNAVEISGHFQCTGEMVTDLCRARDDFGMEIAALSVEFGGGFAPDRPVNRTFRPNRLEEDFDKVVDYCKRMGTRYVRYAGMPVSLLDAMDNVEAYCRSAEEYALRLGERGLGLCMHEHDDEFSRIGGKTYYEWAVELAPHLQFEFCTGGASHAAMDLGDTLRLVRDRVPLIHFTDIKVARPIPGEGRKPLQDKILGCPLGDGNINVKKFMDAALECGNRYFIIEVSDFRGEDPYAGMERAAGNLKKLGYGHCF